MHYIRSSYLTPHILVLLTGVEPATEGYAVRSSTWLGYRSKCTTTGKGGRLMRPPYRKMSIMERFVLAYFLLLKVFGKIIHSHIPKFFRNIHIDIHCSAYV